MSEYILKRDLPFAKAGSKIIIEEHDILVDNRQHLYVEKRDQLDRLIFESWIEEVKPREWYMVISPGRPNVSFPTMEMAVLESMERGAAASVEIIKVREIKEEEVKSKGRDIIINGYSPYNRKIIE